MFEKLFPFYIEKLLLQEEEKVYQQLSIDLDEQTKKELVVDWIEIWKYQNNLR